MFDTRLAAAYHHPRACARAPLPGAIWRRWGVAAGQPKTSKGSSVPEATSAARHHTCDVSGRSSAWHDQTMRPPQHDHRSVHEKPVPSSQAEAAGAARRVPPRGAVTASTVLQPPTRQQVRSLQAEHHRGPLPTGRSPRPALAWHLCCFLSRGSAGLGILETDHRSQSPLASEGCGA